MSYNRLICAVLFVAVFGMPAGSQPQRTSASKMCQDRTADLAVVLKCGQEAEAAGRFDDAIEVFEGILRLDKSDTTVQLRAEAMSGLTRARNDLRDDQRSVGAQIRSFLQDHLLWLFPLALYLSYRILVNAFPREGIDVSFSDLNAASATANANGRSLTAELLALLEDPEPLAVRGLQMNTMPGTGQPAFGVLRPAIAMTQAADFSSSKYPVKMGEFEFGLDDIARVFDRVCGWPRAGTLVGWLSCGKGWAVSGAELSKGRFRDYRKAPARWHATAAGEDARGEALASIAAQILVDARNNKYTDSWQSLKSCQDGIKAMRVAQTVTDFKKARERFELALRHDSGNWIARFYLALSFCSEDTGKPAIALRHFKILDEVLRRVACESGFKDIANAKSAKMKRKHGSHFLRRFAARIRHRMKRGNQESLRSAARLQGLFQHLVDYPTCPFIIQYNIALALDQLEQLGGPQELEPHLGEGVVWTGALKSLRVVATLNDRGEDDKGPYSQYARLLNDRERLELSLYAQAALASIISRRGKPGAEAELRKIRKDIEGSICHAQEKDRCLSSAIETWRANETAQAVVFTSLARALAANPDFSDHGETRDLLYRAIALEPNLVDAYALLADLYMTHHELAENWQDRADSLLKRAHELNPTCANISNLSRVLGEIKAKPGARAASH